MKRILFAGMCLVFCSLVLAASTYAQPLPDDRIQEVAPDTFRVAFETSKGPFVAEVYRRWGPAAADRFYHLVRLGFFDGVSVYRVVPSYVAQFGIHNQAEVNAAWRPLPIPDEPPFASNVRGTIAFARGGPETRTTQVFINLKDNPMLDALDYGGVKGYPPFAQIVSGMDEAVAMFNGQYGNAPAMRQDSINARGRAYLDSAYPGLDYIIEARIVSSE